MPDRRHLTMIALALAASAAAVGVVASAPSTEPAGGDPLAAAPRGERSAAPREEVPSGEGWEASPPVRREGSPRPRPPVAPGRPSGPLPPSPHDVEAGLRSQGGAASPRPSPRPPERSSAGVRGPAGDAGSSASGPSAAVPDGFRDAASAERADWLEARMTDFVATISPEFAGAGLSRSCNASGDVCTFEGPATDDFAARWVKALSYGEMTEDTLQGTNLRDFSFYETDEGLKFSITARHPDR